MDIQQMIEEIFREHPAKMRVVKYLFIHGLGLTNDGEIRCGGIKISYNNVARALGISPVTVSQAVRMILQNSKLRVIFLNLEPTFTLTKSGKYKMLTMSLRTDDARRISTLISKLSENSGGTRILKLIIYPSLHHDLNIEVVLKDS